MGSLADYPAWQAGAALARDRQSNCCMSATGEGTNGWIPHTYGIIERYIPAQVKPMRAAHQQHWAVNFTAINWLHVPVALASMLALAAIFALSLWRRRLDDLTLLAATVSWPCSATPSSAPSYPARTTAMARGWCGLRPSWC